jgi:4-hydroxy-tetrahydrodipicolinate reductase
MIKIAVVGCMGRMGKRIMSLAEEHNELENCVGLEIKGSPYSGTEFCGVKVSDNISQIEQADVVIDFTPVADKEEILKAAVKYKKAVVIGTTGLNTGQVEIIEKAAKNIPVVYSPNMSVGVNVMFELVRLAAAKLKDYKVSIVEAHHVHKKDAPSGTAKKFAEIIEKQNQKKVEDIQAIREGEIVGDHKIILESDVDTIELSHHAKTRDIFVKGALKAALWVNDKPAGLYDMHDVLKV